MPITGDHPLQQVRRDPERLRVHRVRRQGLGGDGHGPRRVALQRPPDQGDAEEDQQTRYQYNEPTTSRPRLPRPCRVRRSRTWIRVRRTQATRVPWQSCLLFALLMKHFSFTFGLNVGFITVQKRSFSKFQTEEDNCIFGFISQLRFWV